MARKTICTPELIQDVAGNIKLGMSNHDAAVLAGIGESTYYIWLARGEKEIERLAASPRAQPRQREAPFVEFAKAIKGAVPVRKRLLIGRIQQASRGGETTTETRRKVVGGRVVEEITVIRQTEPQWTAAAWLLERMHPEEFGRRQQIDLDWRKAAAKDGYDPDAIFEAMVRAAMDTESGDEQEADE